MFPPPKEITIPPHLRVSGMCSIEKKSGCLRQERGISYEQKVKLTTDKENKNSLYLAQESFLKINSEYIKENYGFNLAEKYLTNAGLKQEYSVSPIFFNNCSFPDKNNTISIIALMIMVGLTPLLAIGVFLLYKRDIDRMNSELSSRTQDNSEEERLIEQTQPSYNTV